MAISLGKTNFFGGVNSKLVLEAGLELGVPDFSARRILKEVVTRLPIALEGVDGESAKAPRNGARGG